MRHNGTPGVEPPGLRAAQCGLVRPTPAPRAARPLHADRPGHAGQRPLPALAPRASVRTPTQAARTDEPREPRLHAARPAAAAGVAGLGPYGGEIRRACRFGPAAGFRVHSRAERSRSPPPRADRGDHDLPVVERPSPRAGGLASLASGLGRVLASPGETAAQPTWHERVLDTNSRPAARAATGLAVSACRSAAARRSPCRKGEGKQRRGRARVAVCLARPNRRFSERACGHRPSNPFSPLRFRAAVVEQKGTVLHLVDDGVLPGRRGPNLCRTAERELKLAEDAELRRRLELCDHVASKEAGSVGCPGLSRRRRFRSCFRGVDGGVGRVGAGGARGGGAGGATGSAAARVRFSEISTCFWMARRIFPVRESPALRGRGGRFEAVGARGSGGGAALTGVHRRSQAF